MKNANSLAPPLTYWKGNSTVGPITLCLPGPPGDSEVPGWVSGLTPPCYHHLGALKRNRKQDLSWMDLTRISEVRPSLGYYIPQEILKSSQFKNHWSNPTFSLQIKTQEWQNVDQDHLCLASPQVQSFSCSSHFYGVLGEGFFHSCARRFPQLDNALSKMQLG